MRVPRRLSSPRQRTLSHRWLAGGPGEAPEESGWTKGNASGSSWLGSDVVLCGVLGDEVIRGLIQNHEGLISVGDMGMGRPQPNVKDWMPAFVLPGSVYDQSPMVPIGVAREVEVVPTAPIEGPDVLLDPELWKGLVKGSFTLIW